MKAVSLLMILSFSLSLSLVFIMHVFIDPCFQIFLPFLFRVLIFVTIMHCRGAAFSGGSVLLYGPPGTGKTTLGRACAEATGASLIELRATDVVHGTGALIEK